jgi:hypothetical protein
MSPVDEKLERAGEKLQATADSWAAQGGIKAKVAPKLADDAVFVRKLKPSLIKARAKGEAPTNEKPAEGRVAPAGPQLGERLKPKSERKQGGPSPFLVLGVAFAVGIAVAKVIDWRGHAHPRD